jgi:hypothetical protein
MITPAVWFLWEFLLHYPKSFVQLSGSTIQLQCKTVFGVERNIKEPDFPSDDVIQSMEQMLPPGCVHDWFNSSCQQAQLHYSKWIPSSNTPKAIVIFLHSICTHSVKYNPLPNTDRKVRSRSGRLHARCPERDSGPCGAWNHETPPSKGPCGAWNHKKPLSKLMRVAFNP